MKNAKSYHYSPMIPEPPTQFISLLSMVRVLAESTPENGSDHLLRLAAFSKNIMNKLRPPTDYLRALTNNQTESELRVYITGDGSDVYEDTFMSIAKQNNTEFTPTLILVGTRLGLDKITPVYWEALKYSLQMPQSVGIAG